MNDNIIDLLPMGVLVYDSTDFLEKINEFYTLDRENDFEKISKIIKEQLNLLYKNKKVSEILGSEHKTFIENKEIICNMSFLTEFISNIRANNRFLNKHIEIQTSNKEIFLLSIKSDLNTFYNENKIVLLVEAVSPESFLSLQQNNTKYKMILEHTDSLHLTLNKDYQVIECSEKICELLDIKAENFLYKNIKHFICKDSFELFEESIASVMSGYKINSLEIKMIGKNSCKWFSFNMGALFNGTIKVFVLLSDITSIKTAEFKILEKKKARKEILKKEIFNLKLALSESHLLV